MSTVRRTEYCSCGASIQIVGASKVGVEKAFALWRESHVGDGYGPATRQQAYMARIHSDQRDAAQRAQEVHGETASQSLS